LAIILNTTDPSQAMTRVSMLQQLSTSQSSLLAAAQSADQLYQQSVATASQATATAKKLSADLVQKQAQINAALAQSQQVLAKLTAAQRAQLIAAQNAKEAADQAKAQIALAAFNKAQAAQAAAARSAASRTAAARDATAAAAAAANKTLIKTVALPQSPGGSSVAQRAVASAMTRLGDRYVFGATGPKRFDCSGLVQWAFRQAGISTTHYTGTLWNDYRHIPESQLKPGDLVFFYRDHHHVGIYIGNGLMINAPHTGDVVRIASISAHGYYSGAVRVVG
jgi:cell wall-associated NlpC family hydrolase